MHVMVTVLQFHDMSLHRGGFADEPESRSKRDQFKIHLLDSEMLNLVSECAQYGQKAIIYVQST